MNFFVTYDYNYQLSGIEHAQLKRLKALGKTKSAIVTLSYNRFLDDIRQYVSLKSDQLINMYDYFQGVWHATRKHFAFEPIHLRSLLCGNEFVENIEQGKHVIYGNGKHTKTIYLNAGSQFSEVDRVEYFDNYGSIVRTDFYDSRGFLSMSDIYGQRGGVAREINYNLRGQSVLESYYHDDGNGNISVSWLLNWKNKQYFITNKHELETIFLDSLNLEFNQNNIFISDRAYKTDDGLIGMNSSRKLFIYWHNVFVPDGGIVNKTKPFDTLLFEIEHSDKIDGLLAATDREVDDLKVATNYKLSVLKLNSFILDANKQLTHGSSDNDKFDIITVARIFPEKRILLGVEMMSKLIRVNPNVQWDIFGYGMPGYLQKVESAIEAKGLSKNITIHPYTRDLDRFYLQSKVFWMTSKFEGFNMAQAEAQAQGVPVVAFDIDYGPSELLTDAQNGYLVENNDVARFVGVTNNLLNDNTLQNKMRKAAKEDIKRFDTYHFLKQWERLSER